MKQLPDFSAEKLTPGRLEELKNQGYKQAEIARMFNITTAYVSKLRHKYPAQASWTARELAVQKYWPWKCTEAHTRSTVYKRMREHLEFMTTNGEGMDADKLKRLQGEYNKLRRDNVVVEFDPEIPPIDGVAGSFGGWRYVPRKPSDDGLIIRVNAVTDLTNDGRVFWMFPEREPLDSD